MKSTFSRTFFPAALLLLTALLLVGASFQILVKNYLVNESYADLESDGTTIASLASAYYTEGSLSGRNFLVNLSVASDVSDADAVIFDAEGTLVLCSDAPFGCEHQGWTVNKEYLQQVFSHGSAKNTGVTSSLYPDQRYVVSVPILNAKDQSYVGIVMVSKPMSSTLVILDRLSDIYLFVSFLSVVAVTIIMSIFAFPLIFIHIFVVIRPPCSPILWEKYIIHYSSCIR